MATTNRTPRNPTRLHDWLPVAVVLLSVLIAWYGAAWAMNAPGAIERVLDAEAGYPQMELFEATMTMERPLMPAPHQVAHGLLREPDRVASGLATQPDLPRHRDGAVHVAGFCAWALRWGCCCRC
jgi:hypothetical protein